MTYKSKQEPAGVKQQNIAYVGQLKKYLWMFLKLLI